MIKNVTSPWFKVDDPYPSYFDALHNAVGRDRRKMNIYAALFTE